VDSNEAAIARAEAAEAKLAEEEGWAEHYKRAYEVAFDQAMANGGAYQDLRRRCEGVIDDLCKSTPQDDRTLYTMGQRSGRLKAAELLCELLSVGDT
jgi:hypothetical protein